MSKDDNIICLMHANQILEKMTKKKKDNFRSRKDITKN